MPNNSSSVWENNFTTYNPSTHGYNIIYTTQHLQNQEGMTLSHDKELKNDQRKQNRLKLNKKQ